MAELFSLIFQFLMFLALLLIGYLFGRAAEKRHYASIQEREHTYRKLLLFSERFPPGSLMHCDSELVKGSTVISVDYFKRFVAGLRTLFGGRLTTYESLLDRARRESVLRMKEQAAALGARTIFNVKFETVSITKGAAGQIGCVEVLAYGTALIEPERRRG